MRRPAAFLCTYFPESYEPTILCDYYLAEVSLEYPNGALERLVTFKSPYYQKLSATESNSVKHTEDSTKPKREHRGIEYYGYTTIESL